MGDAVSVLGTAAGRGRDNVRTSSPTEPLAPKQTESARGSPEARRVLGPGGDAGFQAGRVQGRRLLRDAL